MALPVRTAENTEVITKVQGFPPCSAL